MPPTTQDSSLDLALRELEAAKRRVAQATQQEARVQRTYYASCCDDERIRLLKELRAVIELRKESVSQHKALQVLFDGTKR